MAKVHNFRVGAVHVRTPGKAVKKGEAPEFDLDAIVPGAEGPNNALVPGVLPITDDQAAALRDHKVYAGMIDAGEIAITSDDASDGNTAAVAAQARAAAQKDAIAKTEEKAKEADKAPPGAPAKA